MSGEPQLERSVLEGKEREKLQAIAEALGIKPTARAKKADLIDGILRATGVEVPAAAPEAAKPKRTVRKRAAEAVAEPPSGAGDGSPVATLAVEDASQAAGEAGMPAIEPAGSGGRTEPAGSGGRTEPAGSGGRTEPAGSGGRTEPAGSGGRTEPAGSGGRTEPAGSGGMTEPAGSGGMTEPAGSGGMTEPAGSGGMTEPTGAGRATHEEPGGSGEEGSGGGRQPIAASGSTPEPTGDRNGGERAGAGQPASSAPRPQPARPTQGPQGQGANQERAPQGQPGPGNHIGPPPGNQSHPGPGNQSQPPQVNQQHSPGQAGQGAPVEGDVRRNRRRRGRDRDRVGSGYDQQAQQADQAYSGDPLPCDGLLELRPEGFGFLRSSGYLQGSDDVYVSTSQVRKFALRAGDRIVGASRPATTQEKFGALLRIDSVGDQSPEEALRRPRFEDLTPLFADERLTLELADPSDPASTTGRIIDLLSPLGKGQRGLIVSPPKAGKTTVLKHIARSIEANHPDVDLMMVLLGERPEVVTDMRRSVQGEVTGSTFDRPAEEHTHVAEMAIEVAKRRVELGRDVVILLDGITRLSRAYNLAGPTTGRVLPGGVDSGALHPPKKLFGAARKLEEGGSLTILATALVETGSTMDAVILEELQGTGNMELRLDRRLAERRMYPAIDVITSSTSQEELLLSEEELHLVWRLRRELVDAARGGSAAQAYELVHDKLQHSRTNADLLAELARTPA